MELEKFDGNFASPSENASAGTHGRTDRSKTMPPLKVLRAVGDKNFLRQLTTWHSPHLLLHVVL